MFSNAQIGTRLMPFCHERDGFSTSRIVTAPVRNAAAASSINPMSRHVIDAKHQTIASRRSAFRSGADRSKTTISVCALLG